MSKRKRELTQRLEELFSEPALSEPGESVSAPGQGLNQLAKALAAQADPTFLATLLDYIPLPIYIKDREHKWIAINPVFAQMLNRSADQLIGHVDKEQNDDEWQHDDRVLETGQPEEIETAVTGPDGFVQRRRISRLPILDREGKPQFMIGLVQLMAETKPLNASDIEREVADRNRELVTVNQISQALASQSDLQTALKQVGDIVRRLFNVSEGYIALYDRQTNMLEMPYFIEANQSLDAVPVALGHGLTSVVIQSRQPLLINQDAERRMQELGAIITGRPAQSYLGVPILTGDEAIGVISVQSIETPGLFDEGDIQLLTTIAANMGTAIRNAQLFQAAQQAEQRFRTIADATPIPILISRISDGMVLYANERLGSTFGTRTEELIGRIAPDFYFDPAEHQKLLAQIQREGQITNYELHVKKSNGLPFWVLASLQPMVFNGEHALFSGFYDITERKLAEGQVLQRNMQLAALNRISLELARPSDPTAICELIYQEIGQILDNRNLYVALYDEASRQVSFPIYTIDGERRPVSSRPFGNGLTEYVLTHKTPLLIQHDIDAETEKLGIASIGQSAESWMGAPLLTGDKAIGVITLQDYGRADAYTADQLELLTTIAAQAATALENGRLFTQTQQELAERKLAEKELLKLKLGFERSNDAIFITDIDGIITYVNPGFTRVYGYTSEEAIGKSPRILKSGLLTQEVYQHFWSTLLAKGVVAGEIVNKTKDGRLLTIEGNNNPIIDEAGNIIGFLAVHRDITERKEAELAIQRRADQLAALNRIGEQLVQLTPVEEIVETIYRAIGELIDNRNFYIALHREGESEIYYPIYTFDGVRSEPFSRTFGKALTEHVLITKRPVLIPEDVDGYLAKIGAQSMGRTAYCWMGVPLLVGDTAIGMIALQDYEMPHTYTEADVELLTIIAAQAAIALENARLFAQTRARVQDLAALNEIGRATSGLLDSSQLLELVYEQICRIMRVDGFFVGLFDRDRQTFTFPLCYDRGQRYTEPDSPFDPTTRSAQVVTTGEPLFIRYSEEERQRMFSQPKTMIGDRTGLPASVMFVPLKVGEEVRGVISVQSYESGFHTHENFNLLTNIANQVAVAFENARLFEQTRIRADELSILNELARRLSTRLSIEQVLDETYKGVRQLMNAVNFYIGLYDQPKHEVTFLINVTESVVDQQITTISADEGLTGYIIRNRTSILVKDGVAGWAAKMGEQPVGQNALSWLGVPMIVGDQMLGVMAMQSYDQSNAYDEHDRDLLTVFANQTGIAIQNALLFEETRQRNVELATLNQIISSASQTLDLRTLLDMVLKQTLEVFRFDGGLITIYNETRQKLERIVRTGLPGAIPDDPAEGLENSLCAYVFDSKEPLVIEDFRQGAPIDVSGEIEAGYFSYIGVPLEAKGRMLGTWCGFRKIAGPFSKNTLTLLQAVGHQVGFAVENARLFEQTQRDAERERTINRISAKIRNTQSVEQILKIATEELRLATQSARSVAQTISADDRSREPNGSGGNR